MMKAGEVDIADIPLPNLPQVEDVGTIRPMVSGTIFEIHLAGQFYILNNPETGEMETNIYTENGNYKNEAVAGRTSVDRKHRGPGVHGAGQEGPPRHGHGDRQGIHRAERPAWVGARRSIPQETNTSSEHLAPGTHDRWAGS